MYIFLSYDCLHIIDGGRLNSHIDVFERQFENYFEEKN